MKTKFLSLLVLAGAAVVSWAVVSAALALAQENQPVGGLAAQIQYPVPELGNCRNESECRAYCDQPANLSVCLDFAEKNNLMPKEELERARKFEQAGAKGPGGCRGKNECDSYCNDINNIDECVSFAEKSGMMPPRELEEAKKVQAAIKRGVKPPPCKNRNECDSYCAQPDNMEVCVNFAIEAGFMDEREKQDAQKMLAALKRGVKPPPCKGKNECDSYCSQPENMEACMSFAIEAGMMDDRQKEEAQRTLAAIKKGIKPPACRGKEECDIYCSSDEHFQECLNFAEAAGFMKPEEAEMARKTGGKGPGGCRKKEECEAFCNNPDNQEACFNFAKENGMIRPEELQRMEEGKQRFRESLGNAPEAVKTCLRDAFGADQLTKFESGSAMPSPQIGDKMRECFEKNMRPQGPMGPGMMPDFNQMPQEVRDCFQSKLGDGWQEKIKSGQPPGEAQECFQKMGGPGGPMRGPDGQMMPPGGEFRGGPGGCKTPEECQSYCAEHEEECKNFTAGPGQGPGGPMNPFGPNMQGGPGGNFNPQEACAQAPNPEECLKNAQSFGPMGPQGSGQGGPGFMGGAPCSSPEECEKLGREMMEKFGNVPGGQNPEECAKDPSKCGPPGGGFMDKYRSLTPGGQPGEGGQPGQFECRGEECMRQQPGNTNPGQPGPDGASGGLGKDQFVPWTGQMGPGGRPGPDGQMPQGFPGQPMQPGSPIPGGSYPSTQPGTPGQPMYPGGSPDMNFQPPQGQAPMMPPAQPTDGSAPPPPPAGENPPPPPPSSSASIRSLVGLIYDLFFPVLR